VIVGTLKHLLTTQADITLPVVALELTKPTTLIDILKKTPSVKDVVGAKSYIIVAMKSKQLV